MRRILERVLKTPPSDADALVMRHPTTRMAFLAALACASSALANTVSYTGVATSATLTHASGGVKVTADTNGTQQLLLFTNGTGVGVLGGNGNVEFGEWLTFDFDGYLAEDVVLDINPQIPMGPMLSVQGFGVGGRPLGEFHAASVDLVDVSALFADQPLSKFRVSAASALAFDNFAAGSLTFTVGTTEADSFLIGQTIRGYVAGFGDVRMVEFEGQAGASLHLACSSDDSIARLRIQLVTPQFEEERSIVAQLGATADEVTLPMDLDGTYLLRIESMSDDPGLFALATSLTVADTSPSVMLKGKKGGPTQDVVFAAVAGTALSGSLVANAKVKKDVTVTLFDPDDVEVDLTGVSATLGAHGVQLTNVALASTGDYTLRVAGLTSTKHKLAVELVLTLPAGVSGDAILP